MGKSNKSKSVREIVEEAETNDTHIELVNVLYTKFKQIIKAKGKDINTSTIVTIIATAMKLAGEYKTLSGMEKKAIVITVVKRLIDEESNLSKEDKEILDIIVENALDGIIDQLYELAPKAYGKIRAGCISLCKKK